MKLNRFAKYAWGVLAYNILVILWGGIVRATGSGAGCGQHWPLCDGVVVPQMQFLAQAIEFAHRVSSGLVLPLVLILLTWSWRAYPKGSSVRRGAIFAVVLTITEALLGAGLVLFGWVAHDTSIQRAVSVPLHLVNTFLLLGAITLTAAWATGLPAVRVRGQGWAGWVLGVALVGTLLLGMTGAVTALSDTLFPSASLSEGVAQDFAPAAHFLVRLRVIHPVVAVSVSLYLLVAAGLLLNARPGRLSGRLVRALRTILVIQLLAGALNVALLAPLWLQVLHLLLADLTWIAVVLVAASFLPAAAGEAARKELPAATATAWH